MENRAIELSLKSYVGVLSRASHYLVDLWSMEAFDSFQMRPWRSDSCVREHALAEVFVPKEDIALVIFSGDDRRPEHTFWRQDGYLAFNFSLQGGQECALGPDGKRHSLQPGHCLILDYGDTPIFYQSKPGKPAKMHTSIRFFCSPAALQSFSGMSQSCFQQMFKKPRDKQPLGSAARQFAMDKAMRQLLRDMVTVSPLPSTLRQLYLRAKLTELVYHVARYMEMEKAPAIVAPSVPLLRQRDITILHDIRRLIDAHLTEPPTLQELSRTFGMNINKMTSGFLQLFGSSVHQYVINARLNEAYRLLKTNNYTITEIAEKVGYHQTSSFSRIFRSNFGQSPSVIQKQLNKR